MAKEVADSQGATGPASDSRLDSWKEIAAYLKYSERTVRRWQDEGLPVHRHAHRKRAAVYAYKRELDAWWNQGRVRLEEIERDRATRKRPWALWVGAACLVLVILAPTIYLVRARLRPRAQPPAGKIMFAVLPFENLSGDPSQEYFSDGLTEEMISRLGQIEPERLRIIARTSAIQYKGTKKRIDQIGKELGVDYILEGTVRRAGDRVRVSAQLIQVSDQTHLWARNYERDLRDVLSVQEDVAQAIANEVEIKLTPEEQTRRANAARVNAAAHEAYLKGRYECNKREPAALKRAVEFFEQAIAKDSTYAEGYAGLADGYVLLGEYNVLPAREAFPTAREAASKALQLNEKLAEAHTALAAVKRDYDWDWPGSEREFQRAISLNPGYATAHQWYAELLSEVLGRHQQAIAEIKQAQQIDLLSPIINTIAGRTLLFAGRPDAAIQQLQSTIEMDPGFAHAHFILGDAYLQKGMAEEALSEFRTAVALSPAMSRYTAALAYAYGRVGNRAEARRLLKQLVNQSAHTYVSWFDLATVHAGLGEKDQTFNCLEKAYAEHDAKLRWLKMEAPFESLQSDPRFHNLQRRIGLPP